MAASATHGGAVLRRRAARARARAGLRIPGRRAARAAAAPPGVATGAGLEWDRVGAQVAAFCETAAAAEWVAEGEGLVPAGSLRHALAFLDETGQALTFLRDTVSAGATDGAPKLIGIGCVPDVRPLLRKCVAGRSLSAKQLDGLARALEGARTLETRLRRSSVPGLGEGLALRGELEALLVLLRGAVAPGASALRDGASGGLARVRAVQRDVAIGLGIALLEEGRRLAAAGALEGEPRVLHMHGRACLAVRRGRQGLVGPGKRILGESNSGGTFYLEPSVALEGNDQVLLLRAQEEEETEAILQELSESCKNAEPELHVLLGAVGRLDAAFARARHALWIRGSCPVFSGIGKSQANRLMDKPSEGERLVLDIEGLRHPVLVEAAEGGLPARVPPTTAKDWEAGFSEPSRGNETGISGPGAKENATVPDQREGPAPPVGVDYKVAEGTRVVAVTGPNTGGKTAALKTLGLAALMARAGLYVPSERPARLPFFDKVLANIGDGQSLEQNLSTFSENIQSIRCILAEAGPQSLVLLDEVDSGTDPAEGAALAAAILEHLAGVAGLVVCTTHHSEVKDLATEDPRFVAAAAEFDSATLRPTYRLLWGESGKSCALDIAERLGFEKDVVDCARAMLGRLQAPGGDARGRVGEECTSSVTRDIEEQLQEAELQLAGTRETKVRAQERLEFLRGHLAEAKAGRAAASVRLNDEAWLAVQAYEARIAAAAEGAAEGRLSVSKAEREVQAVITQAAALGRAAERCVFEEAKGEGGVQEDAPTDGGGQPAPWQCIGGRVCIRRFGGAAGTVVALRGGSALVRSSNGLEIWVPLSELRAPE